MSLSIGAILLLARRTGFLGALLPPSPWRARGFVSSPMTALNASQITRAVRVDAINAGQTWSTCAISHVVSSERALGRAEMRAPLPFPRAIFTGAGVMLVVIATLIFFSGRANAAASPEALITGMTGEVLAKVGQSPDPLDPAAMQTLVGRPC
jgi:hypothetical protein